MQPQAPKDSPNDRSLQIPSRNDPADSSQPQRNAAANIMRDRINQIYETAPPNQPNSASQPDQSNPYHRTHDSSKSAMTWQQYHTAWQNYYRQYYERYYMNQLNSQRQAIEAEKVKEEARRNFVSGPQPRQTVVGSHNAQKKPHRFARLIGGREDMPDERTSAQSEIKNELLEKISTRTKKLRRSHHFVPIISALVVGVLFLGLQYNKLVVAQVMAYVSPGSASTENIIIDPTTNLKVSQDPRIIIPKINVDAPVVYTLKSLAESDVQAALREGVVHYPYPGANSIPGQIGNTVLLGHTSNDVFDPGKYKFVFTLIERLQKGDTIYLNYQGTRYTYIINKMEVVNPNQINKLVVDTDKPLVTLVGCVPVGTANQRLLVTAEQVSPDPSKAAAKPAQGDTNKEPAELPNTSRGFLETVFGGN